jgi:hypothetical protein
MVAARGLLFTALLVRAFVGATSFAAAIANHALRARVSFACRFWVAAVIIAAINFAAPKVSGRILVCARTACEGSAGCFLLAALLLGARCCCATVHADLQHTCSASEICTTCFFLAAILTRAERLATGFLIANMQIARTTREALTCALLFTAGSSVAFQLATQVLSLNENKPFWTLEAFAASLFGRTAFARAAVHCEFISASSSSSRT